MLWEHYGQPHGSSVNFLYRVTVRLLLRDDRLVSPGELRLHDRFTNKRFLDELTTYLESTWKHIYTYSFLPACSQLQTAAYVAPPSWDRISVFGTQPKGAKKKNNMDLLFRYTPNFWQLNNCVLHRVKQGVLLSGNGASQTASLLLWLSWCWL